MEDITITHSQGQETYHFKFKGNAEDFFNIWFVNQLLKFITLGFYSPWAKVRTQQYFYGNTELAGSHFQFLANPWVLFRSYIIAVALLMLFAYSDSLFGMVSDAYYIYIVMIAIYLAIMPIFLVMMMSFRLRYSAWRGIGFKFNKDFKGAYRVYLAPVAIVALLVVSIVMPFYLFYSQERVASLDTESVYNVARFHQTTIESLSNDLEINQSREDVQDKATGVNSSDGYLMARQSEGIGFKLKLTHFIPSCLFALLFLALLPYFNFINSRFLARNSLLGTAKVHYLATVRDYYIIYSKWLIATLFVALAWGVAIYLIWFSEILLAYSGDRVRLGIFSVNEATLWIFTTMLVITILCYCLSMAYLKSKQYNLLMGKIEIGDGHRIHANTTFLSYFWLMTSNGIIFTMSLSLLRAWVMIRTARYFLNHTHVQANGSLDDFVAGQKEEINAFAEEVVDTFDLELS